MTSTQIDPKRAIPRDEQERTSKIFVGGVSQEATEADFKTFFMQFGRVLDATLMMDKDTGRPRGFGFVTFDSEAAVDRTLERPLEILGKYIEVKKAQPRGNIRDDDDSRGGRFNKHNKSFGAGGNQGGFDASAGGMGGPAAQGMGAGNVNNNAGNNGMSPAMMAQYWQRMQQYFQMMQQQMAANMGGGGGMNPMMGGGPGGMNPAMMQQMMAMQQGMGRGGQGMFPHPRISASRTCRNTEQKDASGMPQGMNPAMMQQMQQMQQMQMQNGGGNAGPQSAGGNNGGNGTPYGGSNSPMNGGPGARPGYTAQEQLAFEQQKYERQAVQRITPGGGPTSWEGMYDDVPAPGGGMGGGGGGRGGFGGRGGRGGFRGGNGGGSMTPQPQGVAPPANAPTGPKNAGRPGANYRGGGRGGHRGGFHPYARGGG